MRFIDYPTPGDQKLFEKGELTEDELRAVYLQFANINKNEFEALMDWTKASAGSYAVHTTMGYVLRRAGLEARGGAAATDLPESRVARMKKLLAAAKAEFTTSLPLTKKPYFSLVNLIDIARIENDRDAARSYLNTAVAFRPQAVWARIVYIISLEPRWGGSYDDMKKFITDSGSSGGTRDVVLKLEAIMYSDMGEAALQSGDSETTRKNLEQALDRGRRVGTGFNQEMLSSAKATYCKLGGGEPYCVHD